MASKSFPWSSIILLGVVCFVVGGIGGMMFAERDSVDLRVVAAAAVATIVTLGNLLFHMRQAAASFQASFAEDVEHFTRKQIERESTIGHA